jgi:hypothetical protein
MCEVVGRVGASGQSLCLPLQVVQPLRFAPFRERTLRWVGHRCFPLRAGLGVWKPTPAGYALDLL